MLARNAASIKTLVNLQCEAGSHVCTSILSKQEPADAMQRFPILAGSLVKYSPLPVDSA